MLGKILGLIIIGLLGFFAYKQIKAIILKIRERKSQKKEKNAETPLADKQEIKSDKGE